MSEPLVFDPIDKNADPASNAASTTDGGASSENNITPLPTVDCEEDLEDGEITDDEEDGDVKDKSNSAQQNNDKDDCIIISATLPPVKTPIKQNLNVVIDVSTDNSLSSPTGTPSTTTNVSKSKRPQPVEDDHASSIENALASVLKKKGIELEVPTVQKADSRNGLLESSKDSEKSQSRKSRQRKRKREHREKKKESKDKKKSRYDSPEPSPFGGPPPLDDEEMDEYEMLNVRGGSPPPIAALPVPIPLPMLPMGDYDMGNSSYSSYDSNDSAGEDDGGGRRHKRGKRGKKDSKKKRRHRDEGGNREKRRRHSEDGRQEPRKMELCKFYLLECCAKRDNCSYMHSDFPCKYYYLGQDCPEDKDCKFMHGKPLTDQIRNILLKHLESAPTEILGNFKRISRESAIAQMTKRHEALCKKHNVENTWNAIPLAQLFGRRQHNHNNNDSKDKQYQQQLEQLQQQVRQQQMQLEQQQQQQHQQQQQQQQTNKNSIPSLLDMVIKPPDMDDSEDSSPVKVEKPITVNKNNWDSEEDWDNDDNANSNAKSNANSNGNANENLKRDGLMVLDPPAKDAPRHLDLKNLKGILSEKHIEKLHNLGVVNLDQINQLSLGQLNQIGLTIAELGEIQAKAAGNLKDKSNSGNVGHSPRVTPTKPHNPFSSNTNTNSLLTVDYSQYLKDSNLAFDRSDMYTDEDEDNDLVIADDHHEHDDGNNKPASEENSSTLFDELLGFNSKVHKNSFTQQSADENASSGGAQFQSTNFDEIRAIVDAVKNSTKLNNQNPKAHTDNDQPHRSRPRSRTPSQSSTPNASTPEPEEEEVTYERKSMYDYNLQPESGSSEPAKSKVDMDFRFLPSTGDNCKDLDMRLPFTPMLQYTPATIIEASFLSHATIPYELRDVQIPRPNYDSLRLNSAGLEQVMDPRLRRILALPELTQTKSSAMIGRNTRKSSSIASVSESEEIMSPKYFTPGGGGGGGNDERSKKNAAPASSDNVLRDPRRAAKMASQADKSKETAAAASTGIVPQKQNTEIRSLLQRSQWYKDLNSKFKIMVNQQLAQVTTELKKFHQDESANKIFDISFILSNPTLQQILTHLGIFIDDNGEISQIDTDDAEGQQRQEQQSNAANAKNGGGVIDLPNLSQPPPSTPALNFLRNPPPNVPPPTANLFNAGGRPNLSLNVPQFTASVQNTRPSLLGLPPGVPPRFNPFSGNPIPPPIDFLALGGNNVAPGLLGMAPPNMNFGNFGPGGPGGMQQQRKFMQQRNNNGNNQRNQQRSKRI